MNTLGKILEEWDLEIIWTVLLATICVIGLALATQQDADASSDKAPQNSEGQPAIQSGLGIIIASQGNLALRQIRQEMQQDLPVRLRPTLPLPAETISAGNGAPELLAVRQPWSRAGGITSAGRAPSVPFR